MSGSPADSSDPGDIRSVPPCAGDAGAAEWAGVLRQVIEASDAGGGSAPETPELVARLRQVAAKLHGEPFGFDPVVVQLVSALLQTVFRPNRAMAAAWEAVFERVALTLYQEPTTRARLARLWRRICEMPAPPS